MSVEHTHRLRHPHLVEGIVKGVLLTATLSVAGYGAIKVAQSISESQQSNKPIYQDEVQIPGGLTPVETAIRELGVTFTPTVRPEATITAVPVGGLEPGAPKSRYTELFDRISKGQALEAEIKEFNNLVTEQNTITTWQTEKGETRQLPQIEGLRAMYYAVNNRLETVYIAQEKNPYELKEGSIAGVFNPNVSIENKQTGGVTLVAPVVLKLMETNTKGLGLPLPLDVSEGQTTSITFTERDFNGVYSTQAEVTFSKKALLTNITTVGQLRIGKSFVKNAADRPYWQYTSPAPVVVNPNSPPQIKPYVLFLTDKFTNNVTLSSQFGEKIDNIEDSIWVSHSETNLAKRKLTGNDILSAGEAPVFLAANTP